MFDVSQIAKRYFDIRLTVEDDEGMHKLELQLEPPTVKQLGKLTAVAKASEEDAVAELKEAVRSILSKNKAGYIVPNEYVDNLDIDQLTGILMAYMAWVGKEKQKKN